MYIPSADDMFRQMFGAPCNNPIYMEGYEAGYEQAKKEIRDMLDAMKPFYSESTTTNENSSS